LEWKQLSEREIKIHSKFHNKELRSIIKYKRKYPLEYFLQEVKFSKNKIYNLFDNVSEMTQLKGVSMGANNYDLVEIEQNETRQITYTKPDSYVGFRCIAEMESKGDLLK
jgi:hypothetical protein